jgi:hypothetical protein
LIIIQKGLVTLINLASDNFASTGGTGPSPTGEGQIDTRFISRVKDVNIIGRVNGYI